MTVNIGFFDSGQGGLTLWESVRAKFPKLNTIYLGDNGRYPYGNKGQTVLVKYTEQALSFLKTKNSLLTVVACGTASSSAVPLLKGKSATPITGIVESICADAIQVSQGGTIALLGTRYTVRSQVMEKNLRQSGAKEVWAKACPLFVPFVEEGIIEGPMIEPWLSYYLKDIPSNVKVVALACTHFPRLSQALVKFLQQHLNRKVVVWDGENSFSAPENKNTVYLLDSSPSICREIDAFMKALPADQQKSLQTGFSEVYCTDDAARFAEQAEFFTKYPMKEIKVVDLSRS